MPKHKDDIWNEYECIKTKNSGLWARCRKCKKEMQGILNRLKKHSSVCNAPTQSTDVSQPLPSTSSSAPLILPTHPQTSDQQSSSSQQTQQSQNCGKIVQSKLTITKNTEVITTTKDYEEKINLQIGRYFYATNTAFNHVEHEEFIKFSSLLRPGYKPPSAYQIGNSILKKVHTDAMQNTKKKIKGETVSMSLDGWSNIHNCPLVCCSITTSWGDSFLVDTVDTESSSHNAENLCEIALNAIRATREKFDIKIGNFVTDNAANVTKMRKELSEKEDVVHYGCTAHILNLLAKDLEMPTVTSSIIKVVKYFRNKHVPSALYRKAGGKKLAIPIEVRWNTMNDTLKSYLDNRGILVQVCQDHKDKIDNDIIKIVNNTHITMNCVDLLQILSPIAVALDRAQRNSTTIAVAVEIWNQLENDLAQELQENSKVKKAFITRKKMALAGEHYTANMLDHRFLGRNLSNEQKKEAYEYITGVDKNFAAFTMALVAKSHPFPEYMFGSHFDKTSPLLWWKSIILENEKDWPNKEIFLKFSEKLLTAVASTAGLERQFSTFGLVQSKLRNRLGNEKAAQLVFLFKYFNQDSKQSAISDLNWIYKNPQLPLTTAATTSTVTTTSTSTVTLLTGSEHDSDDDMPLVPLH